MSPSRQFTKVAAAVWTSKRFRAASRQAQLLLLYLMTCVHQNSTGSFRAPLGYLSVDLGWPDAEVVTALAELLAAELVGHDPDEDEFYVRGWFRFNPPMNSSHADGTTKLIARIKSERLGAVVLQEFDEAVAADPVVSEAVRNRSKLTDTHYMRGPKSR